jgi:hypothetical protein
MSNAPIQAKTQSINNIRWIAPIIFYVFLQIAPIIIKIGKHTRIIKKKNKSKKENIKDFIIKIIDINGHCTTILSMFWTPSLKVQNQTLINMHDIPHEQLKDHASYTLF